MKTLISWLGHADIRQMKEDRFASLATIAVKFHDAFDEVIILTTENSQESKEFCSWLQSKLNMAGKSNSKVKECFADIDSPVDYSSIATAIRGLLSDLNGGEVFINLTSGTPAMTAISILLGAGLFECKLLQAQDNQTIVSVKLPFDFHAAYKEKATKELVHKLTTNHELSIGFGNIVAYSQVMKKEVSKAQKLAFVDVPCLVLGETGTGKEMMAKAIHQASVRASKPFKAINCGAIPENLIESALFGHVKGAFTGAVANSIGVFEQAKGGTLFLDEVGELSLAAQVKLLRVLQESAFTPVGGSKLIKVDARVIAATHRNLYKMIEENTFREDLFYRLNIGVIKLPPLRQREEDIPELINQLLASSNKKIARHPNIERKIICNNAIKFAKSHYWKGNVRELSNALDRAVLWSQKTEITVQDFQEQVEIPFQNSVDSTINLNLNTPFDLPQHIEKERKNAITQALALFDGNKSKAAKFLKISNRQTLSNWLEE
jgi:transcriptional regulator with PAS, ATPase and Fis domain